MQDGNKWYFKIPAQAPNKFKFFIRGESESDYFLTTQNKWTQSAVRISIIYDCNLDEFWLDSEDPKQYSANILKMFENVEVKSKLVPRLIINENIISPTVISINLTKQFMKKSP